MTERRGRELELVEARYGELEVDPSLDWFIVKRWILGQGWSKQTTAILVFFGAAYPTGAPDNFFADLDLRLAGGGQPGNTSPGVQAAGRPWLQFSYHVEAGDWQPHADPEKGHNMLTFLEGVRRRLEEAN